MLKVLVVDDELLVRVGIKSFIPWDKLGLVLVGEASDGKEALEMIESKSPHIVLLDIKMPVIDGIGVLSAIKEKELKTKVIVLSCSGEYQYVRDALKLGAVDYILKLSMQPDEIMEVLQKVRDSILDTMQEKEVQYNDNYVEAFIAKTIKGIRVDQLQKCIQNDPGIEDFCNKINHNNNIMCTIDIHSEKLEKTNMAGNIINEILKEWEKYSFIINSKIIVIFTCIENASSLQEQIEQLEKVLKSYMKIDFSIGISDFFHGVNDIANAYSECLKSMEYSFYTENNYVFYKDIKDMRRENEVFTIKTFDSIYLSIESMDVQKTQDIINYLFDKIIDSRDYPLTDIRDGLVEIINIFSKVLKLYNKSFSNMREISPYTEVLASKNIYQLRKWFNDFIEEYYKFIRKHLKSRVREEIKRAKEYVLENYNKEIDLSFMAKSIVNQSENYFSYLFKKETGENFIDFLNRVRIEKAKELLISHDYKVFEVTQMVGYKSTGYFIKSFKKYAGCKPNEFRRQILN